MKDIEAKLPSDESLEPISVRLGRVIGYKFQNPELIAFVDRNGHERQVDTLESKDISPETQRRFADRVRQIEMQFTPTVARAAEIVQMRIKRENPHFQGVNLEAVIPKAIEMIVEETAELTDPHAALGYRPRHKKR